ncbi:hypothetical protein B0H14DRAFT_3171121 [Mycena olivaceomarginata]|nr:hypothetical protein B0H14DRAFT_3171121 [Mycena olivaceomarginata]
MTNYTTNQRYPNGYGHGEETEMAYGQHVRRKEKEREVRKRELRGRALWPFSLPHTLSATCSACACPCPTVDVRASVCGVWLHTSSWGHVGLGVRVCMSGWGRAGVGVQCSGVGVQALACRRWHAGVGIQLWTCGCGRADIGVWVQASRHGRAGVGVRVLACGCGRAGVGVRAQVSRSWCPELIRGALLQHALLPLKHIQVSPPPGPPQVHVSGCERVGVGVRVSERGPCIGIPPGYDPQPKGWMEMCIAKQLHGNGCKETAARKRLHGKSRGN